MLTLGSLCGRDRDRAREFLEIMYRVRDELAADLAYSDQQVAAVRKLADDIEREAPKPGVGGFIAEEIRAALDAPVPLAPEARTEEPFENQDLGAADAAVVPVSPDLSGEDQPDA